MKLYNCDIINNFAITSGVIKAENNGYFQLYNSNVASNFAVAYPMAWIYDNGIASLISNSSIHSNFGITINQLAQEINSCNILCFMTESFKQYLADNTETISRTVPSSALIQLLFAELEITNNAKIFDQTELFDAFLATLRINDSQIYNILYSTTALQVVSTKVWVEHSEISDIASAKFILAMLDSDINFMNTQYHSSNSTLLSAIDSRITIEGLKIMMVAGPTVLMDLAR